MRQRLISAISRLFSPRLPDGLVHFGRLLGDISFEPPCNMGDCIIYGDIRVGAFTYFNNGCEISDATVGRYCSIGPRAIIGPGEHPTGYASTHPIAGDPSGITAGMSDEPTYRSFVCTAVSNVAPSKGRTALEHDVWVGAGAVILRGLHVSTGAVIGAGAVVTRNVPPFAVVAGVPAKVLRYRFPEPTREALINSRWWDRDLSAAPIRDFSDPLRFAEMASQLPTAPFRAVTHRRR